IVLLHSTALDDRAALLAARVVEKQSLLADLTLLLSRSDPAPHTADYQREYRQFVTEVRDNRLAQERAHRETARVRDLYRTQATTASDLEDKEFQVAQLQSQGRMILERYRSRWQTALTSLRSDLQDVASQQAQVAEQRAAYTITAPASGTVELVASLSAGSPVQEGELLAVISPRSDFVAQVYVAPRDIGLLHPGMAVRMMVDAFNYSDWGVIEGSVTEISDDFVEVDGRPMFKVTCALARTRLSLALGFAAKGVKGTVESLAKIPTPAIAHVVVRQRLAHFVVIYAVTAKHVVVMDPGDGLVHKQPLDQFAKTWTGVLVLLAPAERFRRGDETVPLARRFWELLAPHRTVMAQAVVGALVFTLLGLATSIYVQKIVDYVLI